MKYKRLALHESGESPRVRKAGTTCDGVKDTTSRGDLTEFELIAILMRTGRKILRPLSAGLRYDMVLDNEDGTFVRIQCKTGILRAGFVEFRVANTDGRRPHGVTYRGQVEGFAVFCPQNRKAYLVPMTAVEDTKGIARLRLDRTRNGQMKRVRCATAFEIQDRRPNSVRSDRLGPNGPD